MGATTGLASMLVSGARGTVRTSTICGLFKSSSMLKGKRRDGVLRCDPYAR